MRRKTTTLRTKATTALAQKGVRVNTRTARTVARITALNTKSRSAKGAIQVINQILDLVA